MAGRTIVVVGGGITGLSAALRLRDELGPQARITVVDQADRLGGKLHTRPFHGGYAEAGAETFLTGDPAAVRLAERVGLGEALRHPEPVPAALAVDGHLRPIPRGTLMGVPGDPSTVADLAPVTGTDRDEGHPVLAPGADVSVGELVRARLGVPVLDRLVDPLLGGVYAGRGDDLSLAATVPALAAACRTESTLTGAVRSALARRVSGGGPVFATVEGGLGRLVDAVAAASGARVRLGAPVRALARDGYAWRVSVGGEVLDADAVVLAVPARPAARLLTGVAPGAAAEIGALDYASVALVTLAVRGARLPELSGFLVPASEGYAVKALTIFTTKWAHLARPDGLAVLRASVGRYGDVAVLHRSDEELAGLVHAELGRLLGHPLPEPERTRVTRWGGALPQYAPGHLDRVGRARAELVDMQGIAVAGAAYDGVGVPACVRSGWAAAQRILDSVA
ncbi:MAG: protoporphyrinogen oxidase [Actinobacteria bacterium 13_1_20CM_3_71_11]|nr:MAG: protoporphyrinogen oxidase [Actinobacteria bacterium 13_1_20CM_3_71_11]